MDMMQLLNKIAKYAEQQGSQIALDFDGKQLTYAPFYSHFMLLKKIQIGWPMTY